MNLTSSINSVHKLPDSAIQKLSGLFVPVKLPKGHLLFKAGRKENNIYVLEKGMVRAYCQNEETNEITFWFGKEGDILLSYKSYIQQQAGYESIELLEDSELHLLKTGDLFQLYNEDIHIANWGRKLAEAELLKTEERLINWQCKSALQRYQDLLQNHAYLLQRVPLGYIASYLGITQVTLSRIRAKVR